MNVLISDNLDPRCVGILEHEGLIVRTAPGLPADELLRVIPEYEVLLVRSATKVTESVIAAGTKLRIIGRAGTGVDNIDLDAATRRGILVMNTPGGNSISAAEHTVAMILALARNIPQAHASLVAGRWERKTFTGVEVLEKTAGVVGLGRIGREVAARCLGLGMNVVAYDPVLAPDAAGKLGIELVALDELFRRSDFITVHTPLSDDTRGLLNEKTLAQCKRGVRIVNCARGGIVDEGALHRALESGQVAGAALDVFSSEPPGNNPLVGHPRVITTPHLGASTEEAQEKVALQIAHAVADALAGRSFTGVVNGAAMYLTLREEVRPYLALAERMGSLAAQLAPGQLKSISVGASGEIPRSSLDLLKSGLLKGILSRTIHDQVNFISAPMLARELGIAVNETREESVSAYVNLLRLRYEIRSGSTLELEGTVIGTSSLRLVGIDGFRLEVNPEGFLLFYHNIDRPGMLARVGAVLADFGVNIAGLSLGRAQAGGQALTVMSLDSGVPEEGLGRLNALEGVSGLRMVLA
jgi:D-3-phosphoglycerate dehydrogenase